MRSLWERVQGLVVGAAWNLLSDLLSGSPIGVNLTGASQPNSASAQQLSQQLAQQQQQQLAATLQATGASGSGNSAAGSNLQMYGFGGMAPAGFGVPGTGLTPGTYFTG